MANAFRSSIRWQTTCLRVKDAVKSSSFYEKHFGFQILAKRKFENHQVCILQFPIIFTYIPNIETTF